jgi:TPR repeat protein
MLSLKRISDLKQIFDIDKLNRSIVAYKENQKNAKALWALHYYCEYGWCEVEINNEKALAFLKGAAQEGHAGASYKLAEYFSNISDEKSLILVKKYTSKAHIKLCRDKIDDCNDEPYYNQQHYMLLLESFENQIPQTAEPTIRNRFKPK